MEHASRFHVLEHAPQRGWCRKGRAGPERHFAEPAISSWLAGSLTPILTSRRTCCLGAPIALLWRFRELPEDLASCGPLPGLLSAADSLLSSVQLLVSGLLCVVALVVAFSSLLPF